jgi:hypothetical protein
MSYKWDFSEFMPRLEGERKPMTAKNKINKKNKYIKNKTKKEIEKMCLGWRERGTP